MHLEDDGAAYSARVEGLEPGTRYLFRMSAVNVEGSSDHSEVGAAADLAARFTADMPCLFKQCQMQAISLF